MTLKRAIKLLVLTAIIAPVQSFPGVSHAAAYSDDLKKYFQLLSASDLGLVDHAARKTLDASAVGAIHAWDNTETGHSGTVQFILRYRSENMECRKLWYILAVSHNPEEVWEVNSCKVDQQWVLSQSPKLL